MPMSMIHLRLSRRNVVNVEGNKEKDYVQMTHEKVMNGYLSSPAGKMLDEINWAS